MMRYLILLFATCAVVALVSSCGSSSTSKQALPGPALAPPGDETDRLLTLTNEARKKKRKPPLSVDPRLILAAQDHSASMAKHGYFDHKGRDGSDFSARMARHGYPLSHSAENLAMAGNAKMILRMWSNSKGHKANMMNAKYTRVGISRVGNYWTAVYSAPDGT